MNQPAKPPKLRRRHFLATALLASPFLLLADAFWVEPTWLKVRHLRLGAGRPTCRLAHFTDVHYRGDRAYLTTVVQKLNSLSPDLTCFTGDLVDEKEHLAEALELLAGIKSPLYGVPGNHDYWSKAAFGDFARALAHSPGYRDAWKAMVRLAIPNALVERLREG